MTTLFLALALSACTISQTNQICQPQRDESGRIARSRAAVSEFKRSNPCPTTGQSTGACRGFTVDHIKPLCNCGPDTPANMQWLSHADAKIKNPIDWATCRNNRKALQ